MLRFTAAMLAFGVELAMLWAYASWGFHLPASLPMRIVAGIGAPLAVAGVWGAFLAPMARRRPPPLVKAALKILVFAGGVTLAWLSGQTILAAAIAVAATVSLVLEFVVGVPTAAAKPPAP